LTKDNGPWKSIRLPAAGIIPTYFLFKVGDRFVPDYALNYSFTPKQVKGIGKTKLSAELFQKLRSGGLS